MRSKLHLDKLRSGGLPGTDAAWLVVDCGSRLLKCAFYIRAGRQLDGGQHRIIDIQQEGLLSADEMAAAVARVLAAAEAPAPVAVVVPQSEAVSQIIDLPNLSGKIDDEKIEKEIRALTGLSEGRVVHDSFQLRPFGPYRAPYWVTVAREETLGRSLAPLLAHGIRIEYVTTSGNALLASFQAAYPDKKNACIVDLGASQSTIAQLVDGQPMHVTHLPHGGETFVEALLAKAVAGFDALEERLFNENLFEDPTFAPALAQSVGLWLDAVAQQISEWQQDLQTDSARPPATRTVYLYGGYTSVPGLIDAFNQYADPALRFAPGAEVASTEPKNPTLLQSCAGTARLASGLSPIQASILPGALAKLRARRKRMIWLNVACAAVFIALAILLVAGISNRTRKVLELEEENNRVARVLEEAEASSELLKERDQLAAWIEPIADRMIASLEAVESFRQLQDARENSVFTVTRFADRRTYFRGLEASEPARSRNSTRPAPQPDEALGLRAFVVDLILEGTPEARLETLADIVKHLRTTGFFANVDRLVLRSRDNPRASISDDSGETYTLMLTLADDSRENAFRSRRKIGSESNRP